MLSTLSPITIIPSSILLIITLEGEARAATTEEWEIAKE